jgi:hypothetical protein
MKNTLRLLAAAVIATAGFAAPAAADTITFTFDCDITGPQCTATTPVGELTLTDNGDAIDLALTLFDGTTDPQELYLNYTGLPLAAGAYFTTDNGSVATDADNQQADGYTIGFFDLQIPDGGNISGNPWLATLKLNDGLGGFINLSTADFNVTSTNGALFAAVLRTGGQSWFGATTSCSADTQDCIQLVPEPASLFLFGGGIAAVAARLRRRKAARS